MLGLNRKRLGVVMYTPSASGGHPRYTQEVMRGLVRVAGDACDFALVSSVDLANEFRSGEYEIFTILPPLIHRDEYSTRMHWALSRLFHYALREFLFVRWLFGMKNVDIIHLQEIGPWFGGGVVFIIRSVLRRKVVMTVHNIKPHRYPRFLPKALFDFFNRSIYRQCDHLFVHSSGLVNDLCSFAGIDRRRVSVAHHGVWTQGAHRPDRRLESSNDGSVLFFGTIRRNKGLHFLLQAIPLCKNVKKLVIAGYPSEPDYFRGEVLPLIDVLGKAGFCVELLDRFIADDQLAELFDAASVIVLPYQDFAAQSGVLFDAIAYSLPVVTTEVGALGETVDWLGIGKTVPDVSPISLASAIDEVIESSDERYCESVFVNARKALSWERHAEVLVAAYKDLQENVH